MKKNIILIIFTILVIMIFILIKNAKNSEFETEKFTFKIDYSANDSCNSLEKKYTEIGNRKIYLICIDDITVKTEQEELSLKKLINNNNNILNDIYKEANKKMIYKDGGSIQYIYENFVITKCNREFGRKDILISNKILDIDVVCQ